MLVCCRILRLKLTSISQKSYFQFASVGGSYDVVDIKNSHLLYVNDPKASLPYMSQVTTAKGQKGIVLKLEQKSKAIIGMYHNIESTDKIDIIANTQNKIASNFQSKFNHIYDISLQPIAEIKYVQPNRKLVNKIQVQGKRKRIQAVSPIIAVCNDIYVGGFVNFVGPLGSGRTTNALQIIQTFTNSDIDNPVGVYLNTNTHDFVQTCHKASKIHKTMSFSRKLLNDINVDSLVHKKNLSSVGVLMLALKCIQVAQSLKKKGNNVLLVVDNINQILANQWTVLQNLNLSISPFNILNKLYAMSSERELGKLKTKDHKHSSGSLTTVAISTAQNTDANQQYSTFGNNIKHLRTLCPQIQFPLQININNTKISSCKLQNEMRSKVNKLIRQKSQKQMLTKLKLVKDEPWQHYYILDSEWWAKSLKNYRPSSISDRDLFLWFIVTNINEDFCAHWKIDCIQAYNRYLNFLARPESLHVGIDQAQLQNFIQLCKSENLFDVFKKDYLN